MSGDGRVGSTLRVDSADFSADTSWVSIMRMPHHIIAWEEQEGQRFRMTKRA